MDLVQAILQETKVPISFESQPLDPKTHGITAQALRKRMETAAAKRNLSEAENERLKMAAEVEKAHPDSIVSWDLPTKSLTLTDLNPTHIGGAFTKLFPEYKYKIDNGQCIIFPSASVLDFQIKSVSAQNETADEVLGKLAPELKIHGISLVSAGSSNLLNKKIEKLELKDVSCREALTRIVQACGPNYIWYLGGMSGSRILSISALR